MLKTLINNNIWFYSTLVLLLSLIVVLIRNSGKVKNKEIILGIPETWIPYLTYVMDHAYDIIYAKHLTTYMASNTMMRVEDKEFSEMSKNFLMMVRISLGVLYDTVYTKHVFKNEEQLIDYMNSYLITKVYRDLASSVVNENSVNKTEEM